MTDFFLKGTFHSRPDLDEFVRTWYVNQLRAAKELPLTINYVEGSERYRFIWLRTFHQPVVIRIEMCDGPPTLTAKVLSGKGGYEPGTIIEEISRNISPKKWNKFKSLLDKADYWKMTIDESDVGLDGAQWVMESITDHGYHLVDRFSPSASFAKACLYLLRLSDLRIDPDEIYR